MIGSFIHAVSLFSNFSLSFKIFIRSLLINMWSGISIDTYDVINEEKGQANRKKGKGISSNSKLLIFHMVIYSVVFFGLCSLPIMKVKIFASRML